LCYWMIPRCSHVLWSLSNKIYPHV
jgi:hypothetical protein